MQKGAKVEDAQKWPKRPNMSSFGKNGVKWALYGRGICLFFIGITPPRMADYWPTIGQPEPTRAVQGRPVPTTAKWEVTVSVCRSPHPQAPPPRPFPGAGARPGLRGVPGAQLPAAPLRRPPGLPRLASPALPALGRSRPGLRGNPHNSMGGGSGRVDQPFPTPILWGGGVRPSPPTRFPVFPEAATFRPEFSLPGFCGVSGRQHPNPP